MIGNSKTGVFEKQQWAAKDPLTREWVNQVIWRILAGRKAEVAVPDRAGLSEQSYEVCRRALVANQLHGMSLVVFAGSLPEVFTPDFRKIIKDDQERTERLNQELMMVFGPQLGDRIAVVSDGLVRKFYVGFGEGNANPRYSRTLSLWVPTLDGRELLSELLTSIGYNRIDSHVGYAFEKVTMGLSHRILIRGNLWDASKNWSLDLEREIWDRAQSISLATELLRCDPTDVALMAMRHFAIDSLLGGGIQLLDLCLILEQAGDSVDWDRIRQIKNMFAKPEWLWGALLGVQVFEQTIGRQFSLPDWARDGIADRQESFWKSFIDSRLCWANPDAKLVEYPRATIKLTLGT